MSLFFIDAKVTGTDSTVISGRYPRCRSSAPNTAVVVVTSVQPISDSRTIRHAAGSATGAGAAGASGDAGVAAEASAASAAHAAPRSARSNQPAVSTAPMPVDSSRAICAPYFRKNQPADLTREAADSIISPGPE